jgi:hypothetical protein
VCHYWFFLEITLLCCYCMDCTPFFGDGRGGIAILAMRQLPRGFFLMNAWHFKDIFRECEAFFKISILFEDIYREIEAFFN